MTHYLLISLEHLNRDLNSVTNDLDRVGFWTDRISRIEVFLSPLHCLIPDGAYGYYDGEIIIPMTGLDRLFRGLGPFCGLKDVLRHEYGHAFADKYPHLVRRNPEFSRYFGSRYDTRIESEYDPNAYLTGYATVSPEEDFAECFMALLKYKGGVERFRHRLLLYRKLKWMKSLARQL